MNEESKIIAKSVGRLTIAIWVVAIILLANLVLSVFPWVFPEFYMTRFSGVTFSQSDIEKPELVDSAFPEKIIPAKQFHNLTIEEQIKGSSLILLARFEEADDGKMKAKITEILKKEPNVVSYYDIGDEHPSSSHEVNEKSTYGDGLVIFFTGSPATMRMSMSYEDERIRGLSDMPLALFKEKCNET